jgi:bifunctional UDP-N-acetylglucosamine pyrophosphorylase/glucosamine-1-phosphate N-acetyltransferase/UDP-N-acetylglucosamine pyrophosphorylase
MSNSPLAIILAAGKGKRMASDLPKVLVPVCGRPMVRYVIDAVRSAGVIRMVVIVGFRGELVRAELAGEPGVEFVDQKQQLGTGHAVMMCGEQLAKQDGPVLILAGDSPMVQAATLRTLLSEFAKLQPACLLGTATESRTRGMGRIVRDAAGDFVAIIEEKDATPEQQAISEVNMSNYVFSPGELLSALEQLTADNAQGEYYLTDCPGVLKAAGKRVLALPVLQPSETLSINTQEDLDVVEAEMRKQVSK